MNMSIDRAMRRPWQYWYEDGLVEMALGAILLAIALLFLAEMAVPAGPAKAGLAALGLPVVVIGGGWLAGRAVKAAKERLTYPRTGYVAYRHERRRDRIVRGLAIGAVVGALVGAVMSRLPSQSWIPTLQGLLTSVAFFLLARKAGVTRFYALAGLSALLGMATSWAGLGDLLGSVVFYGGMGVAVVASGLVTLRDYLRNSRPPAEEGDRGG